MTLPVRRGRAYSVRLVFYSDDPASRIVAGPQFGDLHDAHFGPTGAQVRSAGNGMTRHLLETPKPDGTMWDPTPFRNAPWPLRGLKPVTREPWSIDAQINRDARRRALSTSAPRPLNLCSSVGLARMGRTG